MRDVLNNHVDAVFLEAEMDKTEGFDFVQMLRRKKSNLSIFIISETEERREEALEAGANDYFVRPVTEQQLRDAFRAVNRICLEK